MAQYYRGRGVRFDHPSDNDGFVDHAVRRGAEKTTTGFLWVVLLILAGLTVGTIKMLIQTFGFWLLIIVPGAVLLMVGVGFVSLTMEKGRNAGARLPDSPKQGETS
jgi:hypothetical protein